MSDVIIAGRGRCCDPFSALKEEIDMAVTIAMNARNIADEALTTANAISVNAMKYRGTVGTGGTIASLPAADPDNQGDTYIAVSSGTSPVIYETGDILISNGSVWTVVPSGDDIVPIVTSWQNPPDDAHVPSEKLVKDDLDEISYKIPEIIGQSPIQVTNNITVPDGYIQLEYIESSGTQNIHTGIAVNADNHFEFKFQVKAYNSCQMVSQGNNALRMESSSFRWYSANYHYVFAVALDTDYTVECGKDYITVNGNALTGQTDHDVSTGNDVTFLSKNDNSAFAVARLYYARILDASNILVFNGVPAKRTSDGKVGLYDTVSDTFIINQYTTDNFIAGQQLTKQVTISAPTESLGDLIGRIRSRILNTKSRLNPAITFLNDDGTSISILNQDTPATIGNIPFTLRTQNRQTLAENGDAKCAYIEIVLTLLNNTYIWVEVPGYGYN